MKGMGTNDVDLIRLVVTRCEIDMVEIKREYHALYGVALADAIKVRVFPFCCYFFLIFLLQDETSGDYKKCLLHLIGEA